jgi:hypothetical protein
MGQLLKQLKDAVVLMVRTQPQEDETVITADLKQLFNIEVIEVRCPARVVEWLFLEM